MRDNRGVAPPSASSVRELASSDSRKGKGPKGERPGTQLGAKSQGYAKHSTAVVASDLAERIRFLLPWLDAREHLSDQDARSPAGRVPQGAQRTRGRRTHHPWCRSRRHDPLVEARRGKDRAEVSPGGVKEERSLYEPLKRWFDKVWGIEHKPPDFYTCKVTGSPTGHRRHSGKWSRPDVSIVTIASAEFFVPSNQHKRDSGTHYRPSGLPDAE